MIQSSSESPSLSRPLNIFYGWWIVAASGIILMVNAGMTFYAFGVFLTPVISEFGWSRAEFSGAISLAYLVTGLASPVAGNMTDRFGPRAVIVASAIATGASFVALYLTQSLWFFYLIYLIQAASRTGAHIVPMTSLIANWFKAKRGLAMGMAVTGISIGGVIITPLATYSIAHFGWRISYVILGSLIWVTGVPLALTVVRNRPEQMGLHRYGESLVQGNQEGRRVMDRVWTLKEALKTSTFHLYATAVALLYMAGAAVMTHTVPLLIDRGVSPEHAALVLSFVAGMGILGKTTSGYLADRLSPKFVIAGISLLMALSIVILLHSSSGPSLWLFAMIFGASYGGVIAMQSVLSAYWFGLASLGAILGAVALVGNVGFAIGPVFGGYVFDITGKYDLAFQVFVGSSLLAGLLVLLIRRPRVK